MRSVDFLFKLISPLAALSLKKINSNILKIQDKVLSYFVRYQHVSENMVILCQYDSLTAPIHLCVFIHHLDFKENKKFHVFLCADLFRRYSQLPEKPKFSRINCNQTINISKIQKQQGTAVVIFTGSSFTDTNSGVHPSWISTNLGSGCS